jgi:hypothetical protein
VSVVPPLVQIHEVDLVPAGDRLAGCSVDRPRVSNGDPAGSTSDSYSFDIEGWVLARDQRVAAVKLLHDGKLLWELPTDIARPDVAAAHPDLPWAERSGFYGPVSALTMPPRFTLELRALFEDGSLAPIGVLEGTRAELRSGYQPRLQPLMITTLGRTGSTAVNDTLSSHPRIASYRPYRYETKVATYWIELLRSLSEPASYLRQLSHARNINDRRWWLGELGEDQAVERQTRRTVPRPLPDAGIQRWLGTESVEAVTDFCHRSIDALYCEVAGYFGKPDAAYFVEKYQPRPGVSSLMWEIYPGAREVVLVRDFRDMVSSMFAFYAKHGFDAFGRDQRTSDAEYIERTARNNALSLLTAWKRRSDRAYLLRYEDFVLRPHDTIASVLEYVGVERDDAVVDAMLRSASEQSHWTERHRTTADARASIGRWRHDLSPDLQAVCERALGPVLEEFGYPTGSYVGA